MNTLKVLGILTILVVCGFLIISLSDSVNLSEIDDVVAREAEISSYVKLITAQHPFAWYEGGHYESLAYQDEILTLRADNNGYVVIGDTQSITTLFDATSSKVILNNLNGIQIAHLQRLVEETETYASTLSSGGNIESMIKLFQAAVYRK